jgi:membrane-associated phospholipid phosphatase
VRYSEWLALGYFVWFAAAGARRGLPGSRRWQLLVGGFAMGAAVVATASMAPLIVRDWAPAAYILIGYFLSGRVFVAPSTRLEGWLAGWDRRTLGDPTTRFSNWPPVVLAYLDIVYIGCGLLVPGGFTVLLWTGHAALADRYWTMVTAAEFGSFAPLALVQSRPPWALERAAAFRDRVVHRAASIFVRHGTIGANTFPSGHVAGSLAVGLAVLGVAPVAGAILLALAASIAVACVVGRYHYVIDVVAGAALALVMWGAVALVGV